MRTTRETYSLLVKILVYANVYIAFCAGAQVLLTQRIGGIPFSWDSIAYVFFIMLSTFVQYNMQRWYIIVRERNGTERTQWVVEHRRILLISNLIALAVLLMLCNNLSWTAIGVMAGAEVISTLYYVPPFNLRRYGYIKPFLLGMVWMISCGFVPFLESKKLNDVAWFFLASQFCFVSALGVLFDIKDAVSDFATGTLTYANTFGTTTARIMAAGLIILSAGLFHMTALPGPVKYANDALMLVSLMTAVATNDDRRSGFYYLFIDGLLLLQGLTIPAVLYLNR